MYENIDPELPKLVERLPEGREGFMTEHQADFMYHFVKLVRPRLVVETGFHCGHSACVIMKAMESCGGGTLVSFDIARYDSTTRAAEIVRERFNDFHFVAGDSKETLAPTLSTIFNQQPKATLDLGIIDGGHDIETARNDMLVMESLLRPGGYLWLDDFENNLYRMVGVNIVGREFANSRKNCVRFQTADDRGMMIYQKGF
ncbi:MAG: class I SAM-dependent methyltransferase [Phycisphaerae bacterium]